MPTYNFDHLHQVTPDPDKAAQFYVNIFGAKVLNSHKMEDGRVLIAMELGGTPVSLISPTTQDQEVPSTPKYYGLHHFGVRTDDIDTAFAELKAKGVTFIQDISEPMPGVRMTFLLGPDGVPIELLQRS